MPWLFRLVLLPFCWRCEFYTRDVCCGERADDQSAKKAGKWRRRECAPAKDGNLDLVCTGDMCMKMAATLICFVPVVGGMFWHRPLV